MDRMNPWSAMPRVSIPSDFPSSNLASSSAGSTSSAMCRSKSCWSLNSNGRPGASKNAMHDPSPISKKVWRTLVDRPVWVCRISNASTSGSPRNPS